MNRNEWKINFNRHINLNKCSINAVWYHVAWFMKYIELFYAASVLMLGLS